MMLIRSAAALATMFVRIQVFIREERDDVKREGLRVEVKEPLGLCVPWNLYVGGDGVGEVK